jgi:hypothetical protein
LGWTRKLHLEQKRMDIRPESLYPEDFIVRVVFLAGLLIGLAAMLYLLTRRPVLARIRSSGKAEVIGWWGVLLGPWALSLLAGGRIMHLLDRLEFVLASAIFIAWLLALLLIPCAVVLVTGMWISMRRQSPS